MGRITIFSTDDCYHCARAKRALTSRGIPFLEISLSEYPDKRADMLSLSDRLTVPQVFFNDEYVGGADETVALLSEWDEDPRKGDEDKDTDTYEGKENHDNTISANGNKSNRPKKSPLERYKEEIELLPGPKDLRLYLPMSPAVPTPLPPPRDPMDGCITLPDGPIGKGRCVSVFDMTNDLVSFMPRSNLPWLARMYKRCFVGEEGVSAIMRKFALNDREEAVRFGRMLQRRQLLHHVTEEHLFGDSWYYFRLQPFQEPSVLNSFRVWTERVDPDSCTLLNRLRKQLAGTIAAHTNENSTVDYSAVEADPEYLRFEEAVCELQGVSIADMEHTARLAFGINLYNLMIRHAFVKVGVPCKTSARSRFFRGVQYNVGGDLLSLDDVEHGIVRANARHPYAIFPPFGKSDPRRRLSVNPPLDARIHFALNCGAKSCPPLNNFTSHALNEELRIAAESFCEDDDNVHINERRMRLSLSMLFKWYRRDFTESYNEDSGKVDLCSAVLSYLRGQRRDTLRRMISSGKKVSIVYVPYDWNTNASTRKEFNENRLNPNAISAEAFYPSACF